jgi:hypothetical protein
VGDPAEPRDLEGLTQVARKTLARVPARMRESVVTLAAWRIETTSAQGPGTVVLVELPSGQQAFRGEGVHLGWPQEKLASLWCALSEAAPGEAPFEVPQLG